MEFNYDTQMFRSENLIKILHLELKFLIKVFF